MSSSGPYPPTTAALGGTPTTTVDDPITAVFLFLFVVGAVCHMTILQLNRKRSHKFLASGALFGFCMARITTCTLRLVWSTHNTSIPIAIAAQVFVNAGVIILIIVAIIFAQRILRASHPKVGWHPITNILFKAYYASIIGLLIALIISFVYQLYTLDNDVRNACRIVQLVAATYNALAAFLPFIIVILSTVIPRRDERRVEKFGSGRYRTKIRIILLASLLVTLGAGFRCGIAYVPRPLSNPAWYHSKACFYVFNFTLEIIVIYLYVIVRVDKRFHVPNGSSAQGDYSGTDKGGDVESKNQAEERVPPGRFTTEEEFLDDQTETKKADHENARVHKELENGSRISPPVSAS